MLLSDRGANFLSKLMAEIYCLLGARKLNTAAYHPQSDGLAERFHRTITNMMAKSGRDKRAWDIKLPYLLFAYRAAKQDSTWASPFQLLYSREPGLPITEVLVPVTTEAISTEAGYMEEISVRMAEAWRTAKDCIQQAQEKQRRQHDKGRRPTEFQEGETVYLFMPAKLTGKERKLQSPTDGPYKITRLWPTGAEVVKLKGQDSKPIRIALDRLRKCPEELLQEQKYQSRLRPRAQ